MAIPDPVIPRPPRLRPRWMYRAAFILAGGGAAWLLASGRLISYVRAFRVPIGGAPPNPGPLFGTAILWIIAIAPLTLLAYDLGMQHTEARRLHRFFWKGLRESWRVAWQRPRLEEMAEDFAEKPDDDVVEAWLYAIAFGVAPIALFLTAVPMFRTAPGIVWIGGTGVLFGTMAYYHRRAAPYLLDEPRRWSAFRQWSLLNPNRYEPAGRRFVRAQIVCMVLLPFWWLGGGAIAMQAA